MIVQDEWQAIAQDYSERKLSMSSDNLLALAGIAATIAKRSGFRYIAGLWQETVEVDLVWRVSGLKHVRPTYRAPTWSWAAVDGNVVASSLQAEFFDPRTHTDMKASGRVLSSTHHAISY